MDMHPHKPLFHNALLVAITLIVFSAALLSQPAVQRALAQTSTCTVTVTRLNVRKLPNEGLDSRIVGQMNRGTVFTVTARTAAADWLWGSAPGVTGWANAKYLACPSVVRTLPVNSNLVASRGATYTPIAPYAAPATATIVVRESPVTPIAPMSVTATPTPTAVASCAPGVLYCEDFRSGLLTGWRFDPGWGRLQDGAEYVLAGVGHDWATYVGRSWDNYRLRFRLKLAQGAIHLVYRLTDGPTRYFISFDQNGIYLTRQVRDVFTDLTAAPGQHDLNRWYQVEIAGWGGHLQVYVDGELALDYTDSAPLLRGSFAFETLDDSAAQIDDVEVLPSGSE